MKDGGSGSRPIGEGVSSRRLKANDPTILGLKGIGRWCCRKGGGCLGSHCVEVWTKPPVQLACCAPGRDETRCRGTQAPGLRERDMMGFRDLCMLWP